MASPPSIISRSALAPATTATACRAKRSKKRPSFGINAWNQRILNYTQSRQLNLLRDIGFTAPSWEDLAYVLIAIIVLVGLTWSFFQHLLSGIRHLVMDSGAAFELGINKTFAILTIVGSLLLTALVWFYILGVRS